MSEIMRPGLNVLKEQDQQVQTKERCGDYKLLQSFAEMLNVK